MVVLIIILAAVISIVAIARARTGGEGVLAIVEVNGDIVERIKLEEGQPGREYTVQGWAGPSTVEVEDGRIRMVTSTCRDKICIGMGWADSPGDTIVCLPNRVVVKISGAHPDVDTITE